MCGSQGGILNIFSWGDWGDITDRFPGHPESIDSVIAISEDVVITGSSDGLIRCDSLSVSSNIQCGEYSTKQAPWRRW